MGFTDIGEALRNQFESANAAREIGLAASRNAIRACGNAIRALHRGDPGTAGELLDEAARSLAEAQRACEPHPTVLYAGFIHDAQKEFAEANVTRALIDGGEVPGPDQLGIPATAYAKGMAEAIGEVRRHILDLMRRGELKRCEELLASMDDIYYELTTMDYPDGITMGLRRLTDVARSIIERTRGDFTTSSIQRSLRDALESHSQKLQ